MSQKPDPEWHLEVVNWWDVPGRDEEWKRKEIAMMGSKDDFDQEYGCVFHEPGKTAIDPELLEKLKSQSKEPILVMDNGAYKIYEQPNVNSFYAIGVDVGEGIGRSNTVAQILDISDLTNIKESAIFATNQMNPYNFGTRLMGILEDWGRPPVLVENNNNGLEVLNVLSRTHNYENIVTYTFDGMSKHYNNDSRLGIHNHTNTKYKGITNFRYWINSLNAVSLYDMDTLIEMSNFVKLPNFTFNKRKDSDLDDRVFALIWALFILDPSIANNYYNIIETDDQGRPLKIKPIYDNSELIKNSPLFQGQASIYKRKIVDNFNYTFVGKAEMGKDITRAQDELELRDWLMRWGEKPQRKEDKSPNNDKLYNGDNYMPIVLF